MRRAKLGPASALASGKRIRAALALCACALPACSSADDAAHDAGDRSDADPRGGSGAGQGAAATSGDSGTRRDASMAAGAGGDAARGGAGGGGSGGSGGSQPIGPNPQGIPGVRDAPAWVAELPVAEWTVISRNKLVDVDAAEQLGFPTGAPWSSCEGISGIIDDWNGGARASNYGEAARCWPGAAATAGTAAATSTASISRGKRGCGSATHTTTSGR